MEPKVPKPASPKLAAYLFGDITLDPARRTVRRGGADIRLGKLTYELLLMLIEAAPSVVTQEEVAERLWNDRHVTQDTIRQRVKLLRKALDDDVENPRYFKVVRGQGYRIIPDVETIDLNLPPSVSLGRRPLVAAIAVVIALVIAYWVAPGPQPTADVSEYVARSIPNDKSIAVLPFESLIPDSDNTFFVDGFHNDLLTQLSKLSSLKIISRTSVMEYQDKKKNLRQIGDELNVATILEGSVQRSGDTSAHQCATH
jgi:DNA-binding winged helix-turn-helix (wHTH) protein